MPHSFDRHSRSVAMRQTMSARRRSVMTLAIVLFASLWTSMCQGQMSGAVPYSVGLIAEPGSTIAGHQIHSIHPGYVKLAINDRREVAFSATAAPLNTTDWGIFTQQEAIILSGEEVNGQTIWVGDEDQELDINARGEIVHRGASGEGLDTLFVNRNVVVTKGDVIGGHQVDNIDTRVRINDAGEILFQGRQGLFTQNELVAEAGQSIDGLTIHSYSDYDLNSQGIVGTIAHLESGRGLLVDNQWVFRPGELIDGSPVFDVQDLVHLGDNGEVMALLRVVRNPEEEDLGNLELQTVLTTRAEVIFRSGELVGGLPTGISAAVANSRGNVAFLGWQTQLDGMPLGSALFVDGQVIAREGDWLGSRQIDRILDFDMNNHGDVAFSVTFTDNSDAIYLASVPEPAMLCPLVGAMLLLAGTRRRAREGRTLSHNHTSVSSPYADKSVTRENRTS